MLSLRAAADSFLLHCQFEKNLSSKTLKAYAIDLRQFLEAAGKRADLDCAALDRENIRGYLRSLFSLYREKSVKRKMAVVKALFHYLEEEEAIEHSPFRRMRIRIQEPRLLPRTIELSGVKKILEFAHGRLEESRNGRLHFKCFVALRDALVLELLFATGARVSEICNLRPLDVRRDFSEMKIFGKGARERVLQICIDDIRGLLDEYMKRRSGLFPDCPFLFVNRRGNRLSEQSVRFTVRDFALKTGLKEHITPHMFRHTFATQLLENGVDIRYIQQMLGHSSILTTQIYTSVSKRKQGEILARSHPRAGLF